MPRCSHPPCLPRQVTSSSPEVSGARSDRVRISRALGGSRGRAGAECACRLLNIALLAVTWFARPSVRQSVCPPVCLSGPFVRPEGGYMVKRGQKVDSYLQSILGLQQNTATTRTEVYGYNCILPQLGWKYS